MGGVGGPGGRFGLATWDPEGTVGDMFRTVARFLPPPPPGAESPLLWGDQEHVMKLFGESIDLDLIPSVIPLAGNGSAADRADEFINVFPSLVTARAVLERQGTWEVAEPEVRRAVEAMYRIPPTYLLIGGLKN